MTVPVPYESTAAGPAGTREADAARTFDGSEPCIMLVDDEPVITEVLRLYLEDAGYRRFVTTLDAPGAVDLVRKEHPDLVLLDLMMPQVSGFQVLDRMRQDPLLQRLPVIVLTSATDPESKLRALELGATDFLAKPVDPSELALRVRNILSVKAHQDRLAYCDHVTGLPNRGRFLEQLAHALLCGDGGCAVLQLGMDRFRQINDALGYGAGDRVLGELAARLRATLAEVTPAQGDPARSSATVARTGGDEFMVVVPGPCTPGEAQRVAEALRSGIAQAMVCQDEKLYVTASVGIAVSPGHGGDVDALVAHAGQALSFVKRRGGNAHALYSEEIDTWARERLSLERDLRSALGSGELTLAFQPKVGLADGRILGAEALLRWQHPSRGPVSPTEFIPLAEETGLIVPIGEWVLREACREASAWHRAGHPDLRVAVNVSTRQFQEPGLCELVREALAHSGLSPRFLTLEVTESMLMADPHSAAAILEELNALGVTLSVDDFGTGYSSLAYLKRFSVDELKIDQSFVCDVPDSEDDAAIVTAIVAMARSLGLKVVAEGVEKAEQLAFLTRARCDQYQGFLFSQAVRSEQLLALASAQPPANAASGVRLVR